MEKPCPNCEGEAVCDTVDNGVGEQQCGPYSCETCGWVEEWSEFGEPFIEDLYGWGC